MIKYMLDPFLKYDFYKNLWIMCMGFLSTKKLIIFLYIQWSEHVVRSYVSWSCECILPNSSEKMIQPFQCNKSSLACLLPENSLISLNYLPSHIDKQPARHTGSTKAQQLLVRIKLNSGNEMSSNSVANYERI